MEREQRYQLSTHLLKVNCCSPKGRPASRGERCLPRQRERERDKKQRAEIENIASLVHRFLFASTFYVRMWVFPRMGPKDNRGTSLLKIERLFPRRSTGHSGGTLRQETEKAREKRKMEKRTEKQNMASGGVWVDPKRILQTLQLFK